MRLNKGAEPADGRFDPAIWECTRERERERFHALKKVRPETRDFIFFFQFIFQKS